MLRIRVMILVGVLMSCGFVLGFAQPANAQVSVVGPTLMEYAGAPGERYVGTITIANDSNEEQNVRVYQTDYFFFADGRSPFDLPGTVARSNAAWITPATGAIRLAPRAQVHLTYEVAVPDDASLSGTYWSAIMIEPLALPTAAARKGAVGISSTFRYAVQIATHIGSGSRVVRFAGTQLVTDSAGAPQLMIDVENDGEHAYRPLIWFELFDEQGQLAMRAQEQRGLLYPGTSLRQHFAIGQQARGNYKTLVYVDTGDEAVFALELRLQF